MYNAGDRKDVRKAEKASVTILALRSAFLRSTMASIEGRAWINDLLVRCHLFRNPMSESDRWTAFACGEMNVGQQILADIMALCPDQYILMQREANDRSLADANRNSDDSTDPASGEQPGSEDAGWGDQGRTNSSGDSGSDTD